MEFHSFLKQLLILKIDNVKWLLTKYMRIVTKFTCRFQYRINRPVVLLQESISLINSALRIDKAI